MPTFEELSSTSASVVLPLSITNGVGPDEFLRYGMPVAHTVQTQRLTGDKFPPVEGYETPLAAAVVAVNFTNRVVDKFSQMDVVKDGTRYPYCKVFTRAYLTARCLFRYSFV